MPEGRGEKERRAERARSGAGKNWLKTNPAFQIYLFYNISHHPAFRMARKPFTLTKIFAPSYLRRHCSPGLAGMAIKAGLASTTFQSRYFGNAVTLVTLNYGLNRT